MIWSKKLLESLSEKDLSVKVLVPLFQRMGYQGVRYYHGTIELGKDILMWNSDDLLGRKNYAVVVKVGKISGAAVSANVVAFQAQQALGSKFIDDQTHEDHSVHEVIVVTSGEITKEGHEALQAAWAGAQVQGRIKKIDGERLWELVKKYLPSETVFSSLLEAAKVLNESDPDYGYIAEVAPNEVHLTAFPKRDQAEPIPISFEPRFPDTPEGREQEASFRRFFTCGRAAEVKTEYLTIKGLPSPVQAMLQGLTDGTFLLGPRKSSKTLSASLILRKGAGEEEMLFPLIEFGDNYIGEEEISLGNDQQGIPFRFRLTFSRASNRGNFSFDFKEAESGAFSALRSAEFELALSQGGELVFEEYDTGMRFTSFSVEAGRFGPPSEGFVTILRKLVWIQQKLGVVIPLPEREIFSDEDVRDILGIEKILRAGTFLSGIDDVKVVFRPGALRNILAMHPDGVFGQMKFLQPYHQDLLGTRIFLGSVEMTSRKVRIDPDQMDELARFKNLEEYEAPEVRLISEGEEFEATFKDWPKEPSPSP